MSQRHKIPYWYYTNWNDNLYFESLGGRSSDKHVIGQCSIVELLLPGNSIMVDRGFPIADVLALYRVRLSYLLSLEENNNFLQMR